MAAGPRRDSSSPLKSRLMDPILCWVRKPERGAQESTQTIGVLDIPRFCPWLLGGVRKPDVASQKCVCVVEVDPSASGRDQMQGSWPVAGWACWMAVEQWGDSPDPSNTPQELPPERK